MNLLTTPTNLASDYVASDWIDDILGDVPGRMFDLAVTAPQMPSGSTTVAGTRPAEHSVSAGTASVAG